MKNLQKIAFLLIMCAFLPNSLFSQTTKRDTGIIKGAAYEIVIPTNWNKKLVMYAHGYAAATPTSPKVAPFPLAPVFLERGFAVARSAYKQNGWALPEGVDDTEALRAYFVKTYGKPDTTFMTGHSMGGGITLATIEKFPQLYTGGLALCPLSSRPYIQTKLAFDGLVTFNAMFPDILPKMVDIVSGKAPALFTGGMKEMSQKAKEIEQKIAQQPEKLALFAKHYELKVEDVPNGVLFMDGVLRDIVKQSGGNPFDNTNTLYAGFPDDWEINKNVERLAANATSDRLTIYDRTGIIDKPVLMMHTSYDQLISPTYGVVNYDNMVHQMHKEQNLKVFYTNGQGHCRFTPQETATAFDALRQWSKTKQKPDKMVLAAPAAAITPIAKPKIDTLCYEMRIYTAHKGKLNDLMRRFRNHTTQLFEKNGMTNAGYWTPLDNGDEKLYYVVSYPNRASRELSWKKFMADTTWQRVQKASEVNGKLVEKVESIFLKTTDFSPNNLKSNGNGVWELRIYTASPNNLPHLLSRFRDHTVKLFSEFGITNKIYWTVTDPEQEANKMLYYFLTHPSQAAAKEAFDKFRANPEWQRIRKESEIKGGGSLTTKIESIFLYPTDFSPIK
jgi:pimeloyl-ACP methyl ester carboxylesterase